LDEEAGAAPTPIEDALATPEGLELIALFSRIEDRGVRRRLVALARALVDTSEPAKA
jgi:hypothetical protein